MQNNGWYKGRSGNFLFFSPCKERGHSQSEIHYAKKKTQNKKTNQKNPFPVQFHDVPLLPSLSPDPAQPSGDRWTACPKPALLAAVSHQLPQVASVRCRSTENL